MKSAAPPSPIPATCSVAYKEWAGVCEALADGRQTVLLRKGGIDEGDGAGAFRVEHEHFWLYPTFVHQGQQGLRAAAPPPPADIASIVPISTLVAVDSVHWLDDAAGLPALEPFHVWTEETVLKRFHYRRPGLWVLEARAFVLPEPCSQTVSVAHAGCKTWVDLDEPPSLEGLIPAIDGETWSRRRRALWQSLGAERTRWDADA